MEFTTHEKDLLTNSYVLINQQIDTAGIKFYNAFFTLQPEAKTLFEQVRIDQQGRMFVQILGKVIASIFAPESLAHDFRLLGRRHARYGAEPAHFDAMRQALHMMLQDLLADTYTPQMQAAWDKAYTVMAAQIQNSR